MSQDEEYPQRGYNTEDVEALNGSPTPRKSFLRRHWGKVTIASLIVVPAAVFFLWAAITLGYTYSSGERVGFVQKFSKKGWLCKTYEGEIAMTNLPGQVADKFYFSVRDEALANRINAAAGKQVALKYEQHVGVPTSCFGETEYFVTDVRVVSH